MRAPTALDDIVSGRRSVLVIARASGGRIEPATAASAMSVKVFSTMLGRTFSPDGGGPAGHSEPAPLASRGPVASGYVAIINGSKGRCGFAIGGLDFSGKGGAEGLDASATMIFCAKNEGRLDRRALADRVAAQLAQLPPG